MKSRTEKKWLIACVVFVLALIVACLVLPGQVRNYLLGPEGHYFDSAGVRIHYTDEGRGTPVILIHGLADTANLQWRMKGRIQALAKNYRVIALEMRGHGRSGKPHDASEYGIQLVEDVARLLDHLKIEKAHVVGYSMGGFVTLKLAAAHPERLLSAVPCGAGWQDRTQENLDFAESVAKELEKGKADLLLKRLGVRDRPLNIFERLAAKVALAWFNDPKALAALMRGVPGLEVTEQELRSNKVPALTIVGSRDGFLPDAKALAERMANHELMVLDGGDHMNTDASPAFLNKLQTFLAAHTPPATS